MAAVDRYIEITGRRVSFEYALMRGLNDGEQTARDLATLLGSRLCHVNIIPLNPDELLPYERPDQAGIERFADILRTAGIPTSVRYSRGLDIDAACGQLRAKELGDSIAPRPLS
jgi:23S rRNA (adenine2503-C2)-methyltransferase